MRANGHLGDSIAMRMGIFTENAQTGYLNYALESLIGS